ncbi:S-adenosyl-L-methionine-dependent methyltransferase [Myriangium duriaei CBS 260.36]|uniref:S-adenosyl-L-methionine-dependent methyltransferase n=1 Tax=Myriangium duriaei CBS 260.36 TaxID=1168546 RepID=A0A9P4J866_9PEZI|nr:S-adenosyl-L-methionine-dependent methyltransferase [Myriangium duriaei CBS 260.36]
MHFSALPQLVLSPLSQISLASVLLVLVVVTYFTLSFTELETARKLYSSLRTYARFAWICFFKPHTGDQSGQQQDALESFYKSQAGIYDATRSRLLHGRETMLGLVAAQVKHQAQSGQLPQKPIWVDVGGGTGWNIEQMGQFLHVPSFFHKVYLVDLSPSLCQVARARFARLGWKNVQVVCQDARIFRLGDYEAGIGDDKAVFSIGGSGYDGGLTDDTVQADVLTMSYSLSMIPEFHPVIDSLANLVGPNGIMGVVDFYVQNKVDFQSRNYTGGIIDRHCMWISRVFWRTWFEADRVNLEAARRDYLEYKFGTILSTNARNHFFGFRIPYYIWIGCAKQTKSSLQNLAAIDAAVTESPFISALDVQNQRISKPRRSSSSDRRSKAYESAIVNLAASLPLPAAWYQHHHWRVYYDEQLQKHQQFGDEYIYAFTWEDSRADARLLKITSEDVILAITSAGDNVLSYALDSPKRIHAVDLNPNQNHLLELKAAAFTSLSRQDVWKLFGEGLHENFEQLLINELSPHLSSQAFDYWLHKGPKTFSPSTSRGLYYTGGSRHAINLVRYLGSLLGITSDLAALCTAPTLAEQREIWTKRVRRVLLSRLLTYTVIGSERFLWKALGVPRAQRDMIESDFLSGQTQADATSTPARPATTETTISPSAGVRSGQAIWEYGVNTLDPVAQHTLLTEDNHYYLLCLQGKYTPRCHPAYLSAKAHAKLSTPGAFDRLRIHTDELVEVMARMAEGTLTIAVLMDSMDWFDPKGKEAEVQVLAVRRALKMGGRVLLRSAGLRPWYVSVFEQKGFSCKRVGARGMKGECVDRVNMYASTWICTKVERVE